MTSQLVLLTGGTGFLGYTILVDLLKSGYRVRFAARSQAKIDKVLAAPSIATLNPSSTQLMSCIVPDMTAPGAYDDAVKDVDFIIHAAAPIHAGQDGVPLPKDQFEKVFVKDSVQGSVGVLESAHQKGHRVKRIVMTSSTMAIAPADFLLGADPKAFGVTRGPETRVAVAPAPYDMELVAYCAGKAAALNASEAFVEKNKPRFGIISIIPSWIFGKDELITHTDEIKPSSSTWPLVNDLTSGKKPDPGVGNAVLCSDVARAHVRALDGDVEANQAFLVNVEAQWEDTIPFAKKYFPQAFASGLFKEGLRKPTIPVKWDSSKTRDVLGINLVPYETMVKEVLTQYLELRKAEGKQV